MHGRLRGFDSLCLRNSKYRPGIPEAVATQGSNHGQHKPVKFQGRNEEEREVARSPGISALLSALKACSALKDVQTGTWIHGRSVQNGDVLNVNVANSLIHMYFSCGCLQEARLVFQAMSHRSVVSYNTAMFGYAQNGEAESALELLGRMHEEGLVPNSLTYVAALKACALCAGADDESKSEWLNRGMLIHSQVTANIRQLDLPLANTLVHMYGRCGSVSEAQTVFDKMSRRDQVTWNALMFGYVESADGETALRLYEQMEEEGVELNALSYVAALKACALCATREEAEMKVQGAERWLVKGAEIHSQAARHGLDTDIKVASVLVDMYSKCGSLEKAVSVFSRIKHRDLVFWNSIIMGCAQRGEGEMALDLFARMQEEGFTPNSRTILSALQACGDVATKEEGCLVDGKLVKSLWLEKGREIHTQLVNSRVCSDIFVANKLVDMYAKCGSLREACQVFERMPAHDVVTFNVMIFAYGDSGEEALALQLFEYMHGEGMTRNTQTYVAALKACAGYAGKEEAKLVNGKPVKLSCLEIGAGIHSEAEKTGCDVDVKVACTLLDMYSKCGCMEKATRIFTGMKYRDVVSWNAVVMGHAQGGDGELALRMFSLMQEDGIAPDALAFIAALKACSCMAGTEEGRYLYGNVVKVKSLQRGSFLHGELTMCGYESNLKVANSVLDMYAKCGSMENALRMFNRMDRDSVSWNAMILGYTQSGESQLAIRYFRAMLEDGLTPNDVTLVGVLKACGCLGSLKTGKMIYVDFCDAGLVQDGLMANSLIGFYGRCGSMAEAQEVFDSMQSKQLVTWNALIAGYAHQGDSVQAFELFEKMRKDRLQVDGITFLCILNVCSHAGLVDEGRRYFELMFSEYGLTPRIEHYSCMVDLFGRANRLDDAVKLLEGMRYKPNLSMWRTILGAAGTWKDVKVGKLAFEASVKLDDGNAAPYVLMANIYASEEMWRKVSEG